MPFALESVEKPVDGVNDVFGIDLGSLNEGIYRIDHLLRPEISVDELAPVVLHFLAVLHPPHDLKHQGSAHGLVAIGLDWFGDDVGIYKAGLCFDDYV